jgi:hypothetical protein
MKEKIGRRLLQLQNFAVEIKEIQGTRVNRGFPIREET